jgi:hypothetical protein
MLVQGADADLGLMLVKFQREHDLTSAEMATILAGQLHSALRYVLRAERHPDDPSRRADEE